MTTTFSIDVLVPDATVTVAAAKGLGVSKLLQISAAAFLPVDAVAPPPVKSATRRMPRRTLLRRRRRTRRRTSRDESGDSGDDGFFFGDGGDGAFGGGGFGFGGGGGGWNFDGGDWEESSSSVPDPAFDFVYEVLSWIVLSNCLHFALKKIVRIVAAGGIVDDADREKVPRRLAPIC